jgi:Ribosomal L27 protein
MRRYGHRQDLTRLEIADLQVGPLRSTKKQEGAGLGRDDTIFATRPGTVQFSSGRRDRVFLVEPARIVLGVRRWLGCVTACRGEPGASEADRFGVAGRVRRRRWGRSGSGVGAGL